MATGAAVRRTSISRAPRPASAFRGSVAPILLLLVATLAAYAPVHHHPYFGVDDAAYLTQEPHVNGPLSLAFRWAFTHTYCLNYDPVIFLAHTIDAHVFGLDPRWHHDINVFWHAMNAVLLFWVLRRSTGYAGRSFMVAALFALHPINVENVAWVAELKTLLSAAFFFLALRAYHWYAIRPSRRRMAAVAGLYVLGVLAKPQVITLPFVLLLWDYWPLGRMAASDGEPSPGTTGVAAAAPASLGRLLGEKVPLFVIALLDAVLTMIAERKTAPEDWPYTFSIRSGNAILSYSRYLGKAFWPAHLSYMYPHPGYSLRWGLVWASLALLVLITLVVLTQRRRRYVPVGWFWFLGVLFPMIGLMQIELPALADRWAYTAFVGIYLIVCWVVAEWAQASMFRMRTAQAASIVALLALALLTHRQIGYWADDLTVWTHSADINARNTIAEALAGNILEMRGQRDEGLQHLYRAAEYGPDSHDLDASIALAEHQRGNLGQAIRYYEKALALRAGRNDPADAQLWANLGHAYGDAGDLARAKQCFQQAAHLSSLPPAAPPQARRSGWWHDLASLVRRHL